MRIKFILHLIIFISIVFSFQSYPQNNFPNWAKGIVWYQIFPERFANGDKGNDPTVEKVFPDREPTQNWKITKWTSNWFEQDEWEQKSPGHFRDNLFLRRYGGDLQGVIDHLDYLKDLGVGALYFNPLFESISLHKYDATSYHHIDINFGPDPERDLKLMKSEIPDDISTWKWTSADKLFLKLINETHKRGMKIIVDGVFNHTGTEFWAFKDIVLHGKNSKFADWYIIKSFDDPSTPQNEFEYKGWWNVKAMPEFNRTENNLHSGPKQLIFNATKRWMDPNGDGNPSDGIDGWRLDVAREVPIGFWKDWNKFVKTINPEAYISGELWELSPEFVGEGKPFDALMNYNLAYAVNRFFIAQKDKIKASEFINLLKGIDSTYTSNTLHILMNLIDSHDTDRLSSMIVNPDRQYDRDADEYNPLYNPRKPNNDEYEIQKLIAAFQMTYSGAPMIYYGDEVGMWGADDPHDRKPMVWSNSTRYDDEIITLKNGFKKGFGSYKVEVNYDLLNFYKKIISIRNNNKALREGTLDFISTDNAESMLAFKREYNKKGNEEIIIVVFNTGKSENSFGFNIKGNFRELLEDKKVEVNNGTEVMIPANSIKIFKLETKG